MTEKIFVDTDVIFDLLAKREPFYKFAAQLFTEADKDRLTICPRRDYMARKCFEKKISNPSRWK